MADTDHDVCVYLLLYSDAAAVASREMSRLQSELNNFHQAMEQQVKLQESVAQLNDVCFDMCIHSPLVASKEWGGSGSLAASEKQCVTSCTNIYYDSIQLMHKHYSEKDSKRR